MYGIELRAEADGLTLLARILDPDTLHSLRPMEYDWIHGVRGLIHLHFRHADRIEIKQLRIEGVNA